MSFDKLIKYLKNYFLISILITIILSIALQFFPLVNVTGYEFSLVMTLPLFLIGGGYAIIKHKSSFDKIFLSIGLFLPLIISIISNVLFSICPLSSDIFFYFILSIPSFIIGLVSGKIIAGYFNRFNGLILFFLFLFLLGMTFVEFCFRPQIYFYNPIFGYFPGTMFDENISITIDLILYRILIIGIFFFCYYLIKKFNLSLIKFTFITCLILFLWMIHLKPLFGFGTNEKNIKSELGQEIKTEHFSIYTDPGITYDTVALKFLHEFYYQEIKNKLQIKDDIKITSFIFKNRVQKKKLFGSENADVAKPWLKQIYLDENSFTHSLKHEIVHILAGTFGNYPFKVAKNLNPALIEGVAMAIENNFDELDIDFIAATALKNNYGMEIKKLFSGYNFFGNLSSASYVFSGSFMKYLLNTFGAEKFKQVYKNGDFEEVYAKPFNELQNNYLDYISVKNFKSDKDIAQLYFGRQPLIKRTCPRLTARLETDAWQYFIQKEFQAALELFIYVHESSGSYSSLNGILLTKIQIEEFGSALELAEEKLKAFSNTSYFYNLNLRCADIAILTSDSSKSKHYIKQLRKSQPSIYYYNESVIRNTLLNKGMKTYQSYLLGDNVVKYELLEKLKKDSTNLSSIIPKLVELTRLTQKTVADLEVILHNKYFTKSDETVYAYYKLAEFFFSLGLFDKARIYSDLALLLNERLEFVNIVEEQNKLINYSRNRITN